MFSNYNVLFPVDFSDQGKAVASHVADRARRLRAKLHFLHSVEEGLGLDRVRTGNDQDCYRIHKRVSQTWIRAPERPSSEGQNRYQHDCGTKQEATESASL